MPLIQFPNVPNVPGVPQVVRQALNNVAPQVQAALTSDDPGIAGLVQAPQWGIFDSAGNPVALADSVISFEHSKEWRISDYPIEEGAFESYNKVETPFDQRITFAKGGTDADRADFLDAVDAAVASLELYTVTTPEVTYTGANIVRYDLTRRATAGVTLLLVDLQIREVRVTATSTFSNTKDPSGAKQQNGGTVQTGSPTAPQAAAAAGGAR